MDSQLTGGNKVDKGLLSTTLKLAVKGPIQPKLDFKVVAPGTANDIKETV